MVDLDRLDRLDREVATGAVGHAVVLGALRSWRQVSTRGAKLPTLEPDTSKARQLLGEAGPSMRAGQRLRPLTGPSGASRG